MDEAVRGRNSGDQASVATHNPFADLKAKLEGKKG
jgi:hypothetical protein